MDEQARGPRASGRVVYEWAAAVMLPSVQVLRGADLATTTITTTVLEHLLLVACESHGFNGKLTYFPRNTWPLLVLCTIATTFYNFILTVQLPRREFFRFDFEIYQTPITFTGIRNWLTSLHVPMFVNTQFGIWPHQPSRLILSESSKLRLTFLISLFTGFCHE